MSSEFKNILKHSAVYGLSNILPRMIGFFMLPVYMNVLPESAYGRIEILDNTLNVIQMVVGMGLAASILRFYSEDTDPDARDLVISTAMLFTTVAAIVITVLGILLSSDLSYFIFRNRGHAHPFTVMMIVYLFNSMIEIPLMILRAREKSAIYLMVGVSRFVLGCVLNIVFIVLLRLGVVGWLLSGLWTSIIICSYLVVSTLSSVKRIRLSWPLLKRMMVYSLPLLPAALAMFWIHNGDRYILIATHGDRDTGIYALGYKFAIMITYLIGQPFFLIWSTRMFYIFEGKNGEKIYARTFTYFSSVVFMALLFICVIIKDLVFVLSPDKFKGYKEAYLIVPLVAIGYVMRECSDFFKGVLLIKRRTSYVGWVTALSALVCTALYLFLIEPYGRWGAAWATLATFTTMAAGMFIASQHVHKVPYEFGRLAIMAALGLALYFGIVQIHLENPIVDGLLKGFLSLSFYPILYLCGFFTGEEKEKITAGVTKILSVMRLRKA